MSILSPALDPSQPTGILMEGGFERPNEDRPVTSPYSGDAIALVAQGTAVEVERAVCAALRHLPPPPAAERAEVLDHAALLVGERAEALARTIALEAGKPLKQARGEVARCRDTLRFSAAQARTLAGEMIAMDAGTAGAGKIGMVLREPVGVVGAIAPFNFPLNLVAHKLGPAIAAGCPVVLKPAGQTPLSGLALAGILCEAGLPPGYLTAVPGGGRTVGEALVLHPDVDFISFTGSVPVGWGIRERAPRKHVALELGNSTPVIVTADADLERTAAKLAASGYTHAGQSCISVQRVYVERAVYTRFLDLFRGEVEKLVVGDPMDEATDVGPVIDRGARDRVFAWIDEAREAGAEVVTGGDLTPDDLLRPTVLAGIAPDMKVSCEEVFGPVVGVAPYDGIDEAISLANSAPFGLQAGIFTARVDRALAWSRGLRFGAVTINETPTFRTDQMPYGGVKDSGNTREGPAYAVREMTIEKLVVVELPST